MRVGALDRYGPPGHLWGVLATFVAKNNICCYLKSGGQKCTFLRPNGPGWAGRGKIRFGVKICVEPVKMVILHDQIATFVCDTSSSRLTVLLKLVPEAKIAKNGPKNAFFEKAKM